MAFYKGSLFYDSSPPAITKNFSSSSICSSDVHAEFDLSLPPVLVKRTVSFIERESPIIHDPVSEDESGQIDVVNMAEMIIYALVSQVLTRD